MQSLWLFILMYGVICCATKFEHRLQKLGSLVRAQVKNTETLEDRLASLERNIADLAVESLYSSTDKGTQSEHDESSAGGESSTVGGQSPLSEVPLAEAHVSKRTTVEDVAFHAYLSTSQHYSTHEIFRFDVVPLNVRNSYTQDDGIFNVPVRGVYVFTWTVIAPASEGRIVTDLVVHGIVKGVIVCDSDASQYAGSGLHPATAVVVTWANTGDNVYIRMRQAIGNRMNVLSDGISARTTFSGWRLF